jgi:hypothetical protein
MQNAERISPASSGLQPALLVGGRSEAVEDFHVAGVRRRAVEHFAGPADASHHLAQRRVLEVRQTGAARGVRQEHVPQTGSARLRLELLDRRDRLPACFAFALADELRYGFFVRIDVLVEECFEARDQRPDLVGVLELHGNPPACFLVCAAMIVTCGSGFSPTRHF